MPINNITRSGHDEHYKAEWSAHWTANLLSPSRCSAKSSTMMHIQYFTIENNIKKMYIRSKFRDEVMKEVYGLSLLFKKIHADVVNYKTFDADGANILGK